MRFIITLDTNTRSAENGGRAAGIEERSTFLVFHQRPPTLLDSLKYLSVPFSPAFSFRRYDHVGSQDRTRVLEHLPSFSFLPNLDDIRLYSLVTKALRVRRAKSGQTSLSAQTILI